MADPNGFLNYPRNDNPYRELAERIKDFAELQVPLSTEERQKQAARCMHCDVPFCHQGIFYGGKRAVSGCPNDNHIPEWNDLIYRGLQRKAYERLILTNPFPEFTGRVCPAPCEKSCAEALNGAGVTIKDNERFLGDLGNNEGWVAEIGKAAKATGYKIAIIGSGPAGLSAAWRLNQLGHSVTVFEKSDRLGGLLMYGIPNMKLDKKVVQKRIDLMTELGVTFVTNSEIGKTISYEELSVNFDRIILAIGAGVPRDLKISGRELSGIRFAMDFLTETTKKVLEHGEKNNCPTTLKG
ncbi:glutamate synthase, partial [Lactococcus cremoris subsp. cremoris TIFN5]